MLSWNLTYSEVGSDSENIKRYSMPEARSTFFIVFSFEETGLLRSVSCLTLQLGYSVLFPLPPPLTREPMILPIIGERERVSFSNSML